ncbi:Zinc finger protein 862 [Frankliniella fusca]|uniref:Zinc finger protein 862 n=1 Tax=Frankliniella fusca TaxID=407009 RepID=A0AAE1H5L1_9NEOP|nr:Zinc finger protein 862 [Frankliniella fusca]
MMDELNVDSDLEDEGSNESTRTPKQSKKQDDSAKKKATPSPKHFQITWLSMSQYKGWLQKDPKGDPSYFCCRACGGKRLRGGKTEIDRHMKSGEHQKHAKKISCTQEIASAFRAQSLGPAQQHKENVKKAEINIAAIFAEHNVPIHIVDNVISVFKKVAPDSNILKDVTLDRTKCTAVLTNVVAQTEIEETVENIKNSPFSILVDKSPDISHKKNFCILVKYVDPKTSFIRTDLLHMLELDPIDCSAEKIFGLFENVMNKYEIPMTNIIGLASDNANVMIGVNNSFYSRLKIICPWLVLLNCICHSSHLCSSKACAKLPSEVKKLLSETTNFIANSPKRQAQLQEFQEFYDEKYDFTKSWKTTEFL